MAVKRKRIVRKTEPKPDIVLEIAKQPEPEPEPQPEDKQTGTYFFQTIARFESADGREIRKLEALEKERDPVVVLKSSTRFLDAEGNVIACSEAMTTLKGTISALKGGRW